MEKICTVIQARTSSTRLPGKVLKELPYASGITVIEQIIRRLKRSKKLDGVIIATTEEKNDDGIAGIAHKQGIKVFRGSRKNVLSRYYFAARENAIDLIVRITGDCPCTDPELVDSMIAKHMSAKADYTTNVLKRTYPYGFEAEIFGFDTLEKVFKKAREAYDKEHVTSYIYRNPASFKILQVKAPKELCDPDIRLTLDTEEDYALLSAVFDYLYGKNKHFTLYDIMELFKKKPWLRLINKSVVHKKLFADLSEELNEAAAVLNKQGLGRSAAFLRRNFEK